MKHITLLALPNCLAATVLGPMDVFRNAGLSWHTGQPSGEPVFNVEIASLDGASVTCGNRLSIHPHRALSQVKQTDLLVVSSPGPVVLEFLEAYPEAVKLVRFLHQQGTVIAGICAGVFVLAEAGLLDGKTATTHWVERGVFQARYPKVNLKIARMITDEGDVICAGGVYAATDLALYLVEKLKGRSTALLCAKSLILNTDRQSQAPYAIFDFQKRHGDSQILGAQAWIESNMNHVISIADIAANHGMSARNFTRRFKKATGDTPLVYQQRLRMAAAGGWLEREDLTVEEICIKVGYEDVDFFRTLFRKHMGLTPTAYRAQFRKHVEL